MVRHKWDIVKCLILPLPFLLIAAYLLDLAFAVPAFLLPERLYLALDSGTGAAGLKAARGSSLEAFAVLEDSLLPLPAPGLPDAAYARAAAALPGHAVTAPVVADLRAGLPPFRRARLVSSSPLAAEEVEALAGAARASGLPLSIEAAAGDTGLPLVGLSYRLSARENRLPLELLFSPTARAFPAIEVGNGKASLWKGEGAKLPADLVLRLSVAKEDAGPGLKLVVTDSTGRSSAFAFDLGAGLSEKARVLVISERQGRKSWIESTYEAERASPAEAATKDLHAYELIVLDGLPLARIGGSLLAGILDVSAKGTGSLLFAADTPDFGKKGDNPELEALLPVSLLPKSLKELPDLALLVLIDTSGSMFGDKLSLAKVTGLELLRGLKPTDRVGMLLFSDRRQWAYDFAPNASVSAAPVIDPIPAEGGTDLAAALAEGLGRLATVPLKERHAVVVSDGVTRPADFRALAARARREGVTVSTMGVGSDLNRALLEELARATGGRFYRVASPEEVPSLLFEDRKNEARPPFVQGSFPVLALNGERVATVGGMSLYSSAAGSTVLLTDAVGDPLLASRERANRAVVLFASDLYGSYTADFFARPAAAGVFRDRLDALFAEKPLEVSVLEGARGLHIALRSGELVSPSILLTAPGHVPVEAALTAGPPGSWSVRVLPPARGRYTASILDRGSSLASFSLASNMGGRDGAAMGLLPEDLAGGGGKALAKAAAFRTFRSRVAWLLLLFLATLASTVVLRAKR
jgi:hypothetical protein